MARRVFFSFHFEDDVWRANQVRNSNVVFGPRGAGFFDHSEYEEAKKKGDENIKRLIRRKLRGTSVTVVLIGRRTASRKFVRYEIDQSIAQGNGLLGIFIHHLKTPDEIYLPGISELAETVEDIFNAPLVPRVPRGTAFPTYKWDADAKRFAREIEAAGKRADALRARR